jgi:DNA-directed RNA polymerase specialized sigma subunit
LTKSAAHKFDPSRGAAFGTVAFAWIRARIQSHLYDDLLASSGRHGWPEDGPKGKLVRDGDRSAGGDGEGFSLEDIPDRGGGEATAQGELLRFVPEPCRTVLAMRFGLNGEAEHTLAEIASHIGLSQTRVSQLFARGLDFLRRRAEREADREHTFAAAA